MDEFRRRFLQRLERIVKASSVGIVAACGAKSELPVVRHSDAGSDASDSGGAAGTGFDAASGGFGGGIQIGGTGGIIQVGGSGGIAGSAQCHQAMPGDGGEVLDGGDLFCVDPLDGGACPDPCDIAAYGCIGLSTKIVDVKAGPFGAPATCCYDVITESFPCYVGRTFFIDEGVVTAELRPGTGWTEHMRPDVSALDARTRRALGEAWARDGLFEHASVASFARFAMQLLALGAPAELLRMTHLAAADEVNHAEMSFALASAYLGEPIEPASLPFAGPLAIESDLALVARETVMEGCIGETVATLQALDALALATDPAVRSVLAKTVEDEARHAELAWRFLAWTLEVGGPDVHVAVSRAFVAFQPPAPRTEDLDGVDLAAYRAHGREVASVARNAAERVLQDVVGPLSRRLLARPGPLQACSAAVI